MFSSCGGIQKQGRPIFRSQEPEVSPMVVGTRESFEFATI